MSHDPQKQREPKAQIDVRMRTVNQDLSVLDSIIISRIPEYHQKPGPDICISYELRCENMHSGICKLLIPVSVSETVQSEKGICNT